MRRYWWVVALLAAFGVSASAGERWKLSRRDGDCAPPLCLPAQPGEQPAMPGSPTVPSEPSTAQPPTSAFNEALASAGESGTQPAASYMPGFFGDFIGGVIQTPAAIPVPNGTPGGTAFQSRNIISIDVTQASAIKIAESDSPRPLDRFYYLYNFYGNIGVDTTPQTPGSPLLDVHRHVLGFEKTFLGGDASIGMRLPFFSLAGSPTYDTGFTGDLSIFTKFALINNRQTGNVLSLGLGIATPTGGSPQFLAFGPQGAVGRAPSPRYFPVTLQPYVGYIYNATDRLYPQAFHSFLVPTDAHEPTFLSNDVALGYWLYRNSDGGAIRGIVPTVEVHVNTPFNHRDATVATGDVQMLDSVNLTSGFYVMMPRSVLGAAIGVPLAFGPHSIEVLASYTLRF